MGGSVGLCSAGCVGTTSTDAEMNSGIVLIKPHAVTGAVEDLVRSILRHNGITVKRQKRISAETMEQRGLVDVHYKAIGSKALVDMPQDLNMPEKAREQFVEIFGITWENALSQGLVLNAATAAATLELTPLEISEKWAMLTDGVDLIKMQGGFYVGQVDFYFVVNGFYHTMIAKYTTPGVSVSCLEVEWDPETLPWQKFRLEVVGVTNPQQAATGSIRRSIWEQWQELGLKCEPDIGDNGVHASASPFAGLAEKTNWLGVRPEDDAFGRALIALNVSKELISEWSDGTPVQFEGRRQSLFDLVENLDSPECLWRAGLIAHELQPEFVKSSPVL